MKSKRIRLDRKIKFTNKKHSLPGFVSMIIGFAAMIFLIMSFSLAYASKGSAGENVGIFGGLGLILGLAGFSVGMYSLKNKDVFYTFSWIGIISSTIVWVIVFCIFLIGV